MPVVSFERAALCQIIGKDVPIERLVERMPMMGGDLDRVEGDTITIEWFPDRPDLLTLEGTGRALRAFLGVEPGMPAYPVKKARTELHVDASVAEVRPYAALCFVRGVPFDDSYLETVIDAQEKLTMAPGRRRRKIAIGVHDAAGLEGPFAYTCIGGDEHPFEPLAWEGELSPAQVIAQHPKGQEYGHLLPEGRYPVFLDGAGDVLSMPPVINAAKTTVTAATRDLLLDVTGTDRASVQHTIALLATGFAERGGTIEAVTVHDASGIWNSPDLTPAENILVVEDVNRWLGVRFEAEHMAACLRRMGHDAEDYGNKVLVRTPAWRFDILHAVDLMEDIAIGHGFENFEGRLPVHVTYGESLDHQELEDRLRMLLVGHGFWEARTLTLTDPDHEWTWWGDDPEAHDAVRLRNPVLEEQTLLRTWLVPSLLNVLAHNRHRSMPQRLFELGYVTVEQEGRWVNRLHLAVVEQAAKTGFADIKGLVESLVRDASLPVILAPGSRPGFIAGREGQLVAGTTVVGHFGEVHPETLTCFALGAATVAVELDVSALVNP